MVSGIEMPVHTADADCSLFPMIIRLSVFAVCGDQVMADYSLCHIFANNRGLLHFNALAGVIPCEYRHK